MSPFFSFSIKLGGRRTYRRAEKETEERIAKKEKDEKEVKYKDSKVVYEMSKYISEVIYLNHFFDIFISSL